MDVMVTMHHHRHWPIEMSNMQIYLINILWLWIWSYATCSS
jgi:hypothetical protein